MRGGLVRASLVAVSGLMVVASFPASSAAHPPGDLTVFRRPYDGEGRGLHVVHSDGSGRETLSSLLASFEYSLGHTAISPAGDRVAFDAERRSHRSNIFVARLDGSEVLQLTRGSRRDLEPAWSPDGERLVFDCEIPICVLNADGSGRVRKLAKKGGATPDWAPNGRRIAFSQAGIVTIRPNGTRRKRLTKMAPSPQRR